MAKIPVEVTFETITPLWTGDAWGKMHEIRPSALIGSLRFWFEVLMYFGGILKEKDFDPNKGRFEKELNYKEFRKKLLEKRDNSIETKLQILAEEFKLPISSIIFGTTGWRSLIEIEIKPPNNNKKLLTSNNKHKKEYKYFLGALKFPQLKHDNKIPTWYFKKGFYGNFSVIFKVEKYILEPIFYPLLNFMHHYGYWGGKWNIGYGRLIVKKIKIDNIEIKNWQREIFNLSKFNKENISFGQEKDNNTSILKEVNTCKDLIFYKDRKLKILKNQISSNNLVKIIKKLIELKAKERTKCKHTTLRHKIFGSTNPPPSKDLLPQGSKILPFIYKEEETIKGGFLSIAGLFNLQQTHKRSEE